MTSTQRTYLDPDLWFSLNGSTWMPGTLVLEDGPIVTVRDQRETEHYVPARMVLTNEDYSARADADTLPRPIWTLSVWTSHGHRFMSTDSAVSAEACLTCGAEYALTECPDDPDRAHYVTSAGEEASQCTGNTSMVHGYERVCSNPDGTYRHIDDGTTPEGCPDCGHACPCLLCG